MLLPDPNLSYTSPADPEGLIVDKGTPSPPSKPSGMVHTVLDPLFKANTKGIRNLQTSLHRALPDNKFPLLDFMSCVFGIVEGESVERSDHSCVYKWWWKVLATDVGVLDMERQATKRRVRMFFEWVDSDDYDGYLPKLSRQRYDEMTQLKTALEGQTSDSDFVDVGNLNKLKIICFVLAEHAGQSLTDQHEWVARAHARPITTSLERATFAEEIGLLAYLGAYYLGRVDPGQASKWLVPSILVGFKPFGQENGERNWGVSLTDPSLLKSVYSVGQDLGLDDDKVLEYVSGKGDALTFWRLIWAKLVNENHYHYGCSAFQNGMKRYFSPEYRNVEDGKQGKAWSSKENEAVVGFALKNYEEHQDDRDYVFSLSTFAQEYLDNNPLSLKGEPLPDGTLDRAGRTKTGVAGHVYAEKLLFARLAVKVSLPFEFLFTASYIEKLKELGVWSDMSLHDIDEVLTEIQDAQRAGRPVKLVKLKQDKKKAKDKSSSSSSTTGAKGKGKSSSSSSTTGAKGKSKSSSSSSSTGAKSKGKSSSSSSSTGAKSKGKSAASSTAFGTSSAPQGSKRSASDAAASSSAGGGKKAKQA